MEYGNVPRHRSRIFIVAFLDYQKCEKFEFPDQIRRTVFLNDILQRNVKHDNSYYLKPGDDNYEFISRLVSNKSMIYKYYESLKAYKTYKVCPTLLASMGSYPDSIPLILDDYGIRKITPYECLALQGFPKDYRFPKIPMASAYKQCGNSVAVPVIRRIAENIMKVL
jgi:DNA (cytosine-5)-methyltransferase 1